MINKLGDSFQQQRDSTDIYILCQEKYINNYIRFPKIMDRRTNQIIKDDTHLAA